MKLSGQQQEAVSTIKQWYGQNDPERPFFRLGGFAGTGKTTIMSHIEDSVFQGYTNVASFTGKAVSVLSSKGLPQAKTLHSMLYIPIKKKNKLAWELREPENEFPIMVDEASMVPKDIHRDMMIWGNLILYVGDPGQLEPVNDNFNLMSDTDFTLTEIFRQESGSHILNLAKILRNGRMPKSYGEFNDVRLIGKEDFWKNDMSLIDMYLGPKCQILVGTNDTRHRINMKARTRLGYPREKILCKGEKIIFLQNNCEVGIYNGLMGTVITEPYHKRYTFGKLGVNVMQFDFKPDWSPNIIRGIKCLKAQFGMDGRKFRFGLPDWLCMADYGYAITTHKSQGSEWDYVLVLDEVCGSWNQWRWRYTAITRAKKGLVYAY